MGRSFKLSKYHLLNDILNNINDKTEEELLRLLLLPKKYFPSGYDLIEKEFERRNKNLAEILKEKHKEQGEIEFVFKNVKGDNLNIGDLLVSKDTFYYYPRIITRHYEYLLGALGGVDLGAAGASVAEGQSIPFGFVKGFIKTELGIEPNEIEIKKTYDPKNDLLPLTLICKHIEGAFSIKKESIIKISVWKKGRIMFWTPKLKEIKNVWINKKDIQKFQALAESLGYLIQENISFFKFWKEYREYKRNYK